MHELDEFIQHSGVKGMKWGVRRESSKKQTTEKASRKAKERDDKIADAVRLALGQPMQNYTITGKKRRALTESEEKIADAIRLSLAQPTKDYTVTGKKRRALTEREEKIAKALKVALLPLQQ